jgi:hypothetical protein
MTLLESINWKLASSFRVQSVSQIQFISPDIFCLVTYEKVTLFTFREWTNLRHWYRNGHHY